MAHLPVRGPPGSSTSLWPSSLPPPSWASRQEYLLWEAPLPRFPWCPLPLSSPLSKAKVRCPLLNVKPHAAPSAPPSTQRHSLRHREHRGGLDSRTGAVTQRGQQEPEGHTANQKAHTQRTARFHFHVPTEGRTVPGGAAARGQRPGPRCREMQLPARRSAAIYSRAGRSQDSQGQLPARQSRPQPGSLRG